MEEVPAALLAEVGADQVVGVLAEVVEAGRDSRVTGGDPSEIRGTLRSTIPDADVWLLNPSGVVFGEGGRLDVPGSFHASTGDYLDFGEGDLVRFYADPSRESVLSTARPEAFGFLGESGATSLAVDRTALAVPDREALELVGGDVSLSGAALIARGGQVSLEAQGEVTLSDSVVDVGGMAPGSVSIRGGRLVMTEGSRVLAENAGAGLGGRIDVAARELLTVDASLLSVSASSSGTAGEIHLQASEIVMRNGPRFIYDQEQIPRSWDVGVIADTSGSGDAGEITVEAELVEITSGAQLSAITVGASGVEASGSGGAITIEAGELLITDGGQLAADSWRSTGDAGNITIEAETLEVIGSPRLEFFTGISASSLDFERPNLGNPGAVTIEAKSVLVMNDGQIGAGCDVNCAGKEGGSIEVTAGSLVLRAGGKLNTLAVAGSSGNGGRVTVRAETVLISERGPLGTGIFVRSGGGIFRDAPPAGDAGDVWIETGSLVIEGRGIIAADTVGEGDAGSIAIRADSVELRTNGIINAGTGGAGGGGTIDIRASEAILLDGAGDPPFSLLSVVRRLQLGAPPRITGMFSATSGSGDAGAITLQAPDITVRDGALVLTTTVGGGNAGDVFLSGGSIHIRDGAFVDSTSIPDYDTGEGGGDAGSVTLEAEAAIEIVGLRAPGHPSRVASASLGSGAAGTVLLTAPRILVDGGAVATTALPFTVPFSDPVEGIEGGDIRVEAGELVVRGGGRIDASSFIDGPGGSIDVTASESIVVEGEGSGLASRTGAAGEGGSVTLRAPVIELTDGSELSARSEADPGREAVSRLFGSFVEDGRVGGLPTVATGDAGSVALIAEKVRLSGGTVATNSEAADGGDIAIQAKQLVHLDGGEITAAVRDGAGGNITIDPDAVILQNGSRIVANAGAGSGGNIQITADNYFAFPGSVVDASSELGIDGVVEVHAPDVDLAGKITALPTTFLDAAALMREPCAAPRSGERAGSFAVRGNGGIPPEPDGWLPASVTFAAAPGPGASSPPPAGLGSAPPLAVGTCR